MCDATTALLVVNVASAGLKYKSQKAQQQNAYDRQKRQNDLAKKNAIQRYAAEQLKIRQVLAQAADKDYEATLKARKVRAKFITEAGGAGLAISGSTEALLRDYYRTEGKYRNALRNNMAINVSQFERNLEAIQFGQESQMTYEVPPNHNLLFATQALNVANSYYSLEVAKEMRGLQTGSQKRGHRKSVSSYPAKTYSI
jgi:hypothetical protein